MTVPSVCTISADFKINLDLKQLKKSIKLTPETAYGHEQHHVKSFHNQLKKLADERRASEGDCVPPSNCFNRAKSEKLVLEKKITEVYNREAAHDQQAHPDAPVAGNPMNPITPFPPEPSNAKRP